jgi:hypothetical protein
LQKIPEGKTIQGGDSKWAGNLGGCRRIRTAVKLSMSLMEKASETHTAPQETKPAWCGFSDSKPTSSWFDFLLGFRGFE